MKTLYSIVFLAGLSLCHSSYSNKSIEYYAWLSANEPYEFDKIKANLPLSIINSEEFKQYKKKLLRAKPEYEEVTIDNSFPCFVKMLYFRTKSSKNSTICQRQRIIGPKETRSIFRLMDKSMQYRLDEGCSDACDIKGKHHHWGCRRDVSADEFQNENTETINKH